MDRFNQRSSIWLDATDTENKGNWPWSIKGQKVFLNACSSISILVHRKYLKNSCFKNSVFEFLVRFRINI